MAQYDFLIVGAGIFGATCARLLTDKGYKCLIVEQKSSVGGLAHTDNVSGIDVHIYGPHIFHTSNDIVWEFITKYGEFVPINLNVLSYVNNALYHLPLNMNTIYELFGITWPNDAHAKMYEELTKSKYEDPKNFEEACLNKLGPTIYNTLFKEYYEKLFNGPCTLLEPNILNIPDIRYNYNNSYHTDKYVGVPKDGYTTLVENIIGDDIDIMLNTEFFEKKTRLMNITRYVIYSGSIDTLLDYCYGPLPYISLKYVITNEQEHGNNILGTPIIEFPEKKIAWTRTIEHKWLNPKPDSDEWSTNTIVSYEYPDTYEVGKPKYYPIITTDSKKQYTAYKKLANERYPNILIGGRLGNFNQFTMAETIQAAMYICANIKI